MSLSRKLTLAACVAVLAAACAAAAASRPAPEAASRPDAEPALLRTPDVWCGLLLPGAVLAVAGGRCDAQPLPQAVRALREVRRNLSGATG